MEQISKHSSGILSGEKEKHILLLTDGQININESVVSDAKKDGVIVDTVALGTGVNKQLLLELATDEDHFHEAVNASDLERIYKNVFRNNKFKELADSTDTDNDGLPDVIEELGIPLSNGKVVVTDPNDSDTDDDGWSDGKEVEKIPYTYHKSNSKLLDLFGIDLIEGYTFKTYSDPTLKDTDKDGIMDSLDKYPMGGDPDPLSTENIISVQVVKIPFFIETFAFPVSHDYTITIIKSKKWKKEGDCFILSDDNDDKAPKAFFISDSLKKKLNYHINEIEEKGGFVNWIIPWLPTPSAEDEIVYRANQDIMQFIPKYFEKESSLYYGLWANTVDIESESFNTACNIIARTKSICNIAVATCFCYNFAKSYIKEIGLESAYLSKNELIDKIKVKAYESEESEFSKFKLNEYGNGHYMHNPSNDPKVLKDAVEDSEAVYGYKPKEGGSLDRFVDDKNWKDPAFVEKYRLERLKYIAEEEQIEAIVKEMKSNNCSIEEIARYVCDKRNQIRVESYIDENGNITNLEGYNTAIDRMKKNSYEAFIAKGKTPEQIISSSKTTNHAMDACLGLYDKNYSSYKF